MFSGTSQKETLDKVTKRQMSCAVGAEKAAVPKRGQAVGDHSAQPQLSTYCQHINQ